MTTKLPRSLADCGLARRSTATTRSLNAPADTVYRYLADMRGHHPRFLPPAISDFQLSPVASGPVR